jgi:hypothetical protein
MQQFSGSKQKQKKGWPWKGTVIQVLLKGHLPQDQCKVWGVHVAAQKSNIFLSSCGQCLCIVLYIAFSKAKISGVFHVTMIDEILSLSIESLHYLSNRSKQKNNNNY